MDNVKWNNTLRFHSLKSLCNRETRGCAIMWLWLVSHLILRNSTRSHLHQKPTETFKSEGAVARGQTRVKAHRPLRLVRCHVSALWFTVRLQLMNFTWLQSNPAGKTRSRELVNVCQGAGNTLFKFTFFFLFRMIASSVVNLRQSESPTLPVQWRRKGLQLVRTPCSEKSRGLSSGCFQP